ncbi:MAG: inositol monophosphatase family protein, partial [Leptolyngbyaceae bacterium]|nr:inositol monophosphatase family protein [Leptolyngbyaceae bacterium]
MNSALPQSTYHSALAIALQAAQAAGELLRAEFHRPGGPRGSGAHALIDEEAEALIRQQLRAAFPAYGVRGEELRDQDCLPQDAEQHTWLIDPNDGTASFLKGYRGSAVSIALLRSGIPILGVVYAFSAPQDGGDLFAWAEGCGPLTRNGEPIQRVWATELRHDHTIILSQAGDRHSQANA